MQKMIFFLHYISKIFIFVPDFAEKEFTMAK